MPRLPSHQADNRLIVRHSCGYQGLLWTLAIMATATEPQQLSSTVKSFTLDGKFPEDAAALLAVSGTDLGPTIVALDSAKVDIEVLKLPPKLLSLLQWIFFNIISI